MSARRGVNATFAMLLAAAVLGLTAGQAAAWSATTAPGGAAASAAEVIPQATPPTGANTGPNEVTLTWVPSIGDVPVSYVVRSYAAVTLTPRPVGGTCVGELVVATCVDTGVPAGDWQYTITEVLNNWSGPESTLSVPITVLGPLPPL